MDNQQANESVKAAIIERWRQSSPWEQGRLDILKEAVAHGVEEQLYDTEEQQKYGLQKDEFLMHACWHGLQITNNWWYQYYYKYILFPFMTISIISMGLVNHTNVFVDRYFYGIRWEDISLTALMISFLSLFIVVFFLFGSRYLLLTNRAIYYGKKMRRISKIPLNGLFIRSSIDKASVRPGSNLGEHLRENINGNLLIFLMDIFLFKDCQLRFGALISRRNSDIKRIKGRFQCTYILHVFSFLSRQYNHGLYVLPLRCGFACDRKDYVYSELNVFFGVLLDVSYWTKKFRRDIELSFSSKEDIETYLAGQKIPGCNSEAVISLLNNGADTGDRLFWLPANKRPFGKAYEIHVTTKETWLECNGVKLSDILPLTDIEIYHSHKYFIFLFPHNNKYVAYYVWKKDLFFPFLDIMEILLREKIAYMGSGYAVWDS